MLSTGAATQTYTQPIIPASSFKILPLSSGDSYGGWERTCKILFFSFSRLFTFVFPTFHFRFPDFLLPFYLKKVRKMKSRENEKRFFLLHVLSQPPWIPVVPAHGIVGVDLCCRWKKSCPVCAEVLAYVQSASKATSEHTGLT